MRGRVDREDHKLGGLSQACWILGLTSFLLTFLICEMIIVNNSSYRMGLFMGLKKVLKMVPGPYCSMKMLAVNRCWPPKGVNLDTDLVRNGSGRELSLSQWFSNFKHASELTLRTFQN